MNQSIEKWFENNTEAVYALAKDVFEHPETACEEQYACRITAEYMEENGFDVKKITVPPAAEENGVIAVWGEGKPVIAILGEYDALPGLGQAAVPYRSEIPGPGHGCGHCNMNAGCSAAAIAVKEAMEQEKIGGTIIYMACPAEEANSGKTHMLADGYFENVDLCLAWHDGGFFRVAEHVNQAMTSIEFSFRGAAAHAACNPWDGRSALDAAQLMNMGVEFLREHISDDIKIHYVFREAGEKPNVVPDYAAVFYYVRGKDRKSVDDVLKRVIKVAEGAAVMTDTKMLYHIEGGGYEPILNHTLNQVMYDAAMKIPNISYDQADQQFARQLYYHIQGKEYEGEYLPTSFQPLLGHGFPEMGSTDVNDVSQVIPTAQLFGGGNVQGLPGHHWALTAAAGSAIGQKAAVYAGKVLAQCAYDIFCKTDIVEKCKAELKKAQMGKPAYVPILPER